MGKSCTNLKIFGDRICCQKLNKNRRCKEASQFKKILLQYFEVDVEADSANVHPNHVCEKYISVFLSGA